MNIKELRTKEGLSQSALAKRLGINTSAIGHMENGRMKVSDKIAAKVKEEFGVDIKENVKAAESKVEKTAKTVAKKTKTAVQKAEKAVKKAPVKAKAAAKKVEDKVVADEIEVKKTAAKATRKAKTAVKETAKKVETAAKKTTAKAKETKLTIVVQSPYGGNITAAEIAEKIPAGADTVFVRVDQNKLWWIKGEETGSVDIW